MHNLFQDFRYAVRMLAKSPGFTAIAIVTLALGIGANTAIFSVVNAALLRPMPVERPEELASVYTSDFSGPPYGASSYPDYLDFRDKTDVFSGVAAYSLQMMSMNTGGGETSRRVFGEIVTGNYFDVLGVPAARGRGFLPEEDRTPGTHPVVVLSHALWQRQFGGDEGIVGRTLRLNGTLFTVIGIAPQSFPGMMRGLQTDLWTPVMMINELTPDRDRIGNRGSRRYSIIGRLKPGVSLDTAQAQFRVLAGQLKAAYPQNWIDVAQQGRRITVLSESQSRVDPQVRDPILAFSVLLMVAVQLVLLTACANVANLLLARAAARRREIAIRLSLGASRGRLVQQLLSESVLLAMAGGAAAVLMTLWTTDLLSAVQLPADIPLALDFRPDARVFAFAFGISLFTGVVFGLVPAWQATKPDVIPALKEEGLGQGGTKTRLRSAFVVAQVALSVLLLIGSGLFIRSLQNASAMDPGFDLRAGVLVSMDLGLHGYNEERGLAFFDQLLEKARAIPGVESATLTRYLPLGLNTGRRGTTIEGYTRQPGEDLEFHTSTVSPGYFRCLGIPVLRGREFTAQDRQGAPRVAIVNETFARRFWPDQNPVGKRISIEGPEGNFMEIVGVVRDGKYNTLGEDPLPWFATPLAQTYASDMTLVLRTRGPVKPAADGAMAAIQSLDKTMPATVSTVEQHMGVTLLLPRAGAGLLGGFGGLGLLLAAVGLAGMMSYMVAQRTHEIGVRMALGATRTDVLGLVLGQGMKLTLIGGALGMAVALGVTQLLRGLLYNVSPADPVTFAGVAVVLSGVALAATYLPARRATRVEPMEALRHE